MKLHAALVGLSRPILMVRSLIYPQRVLRQGCYGTWQAIPWTRIEGYDVV